MGKSTVRGEAFVFWRFLDALIVRPQWFSGGIGWMILGLDDREHGGRRTVDDEDLT